MTVNDPRLTDTIARLRTELEPSDARLQLDDLWSRVAALTRDLDAVRVERDAARADAERISAAWAEVIQREQRAANAFEYDVAQRVATASATALTEAADEIENRQPHVMESATVELAWRDGMATAAQMLRARAVGVSDAAPEGNWQAVEAKSSTWNPNVTRLTVPPHPVAAPNPEDPK